MHIQNILSAEADRFDANLLNLRHVGRPLVRNAVNFEHPGFARQQKEQLKIAQRS
jgi:hypothetical protein